jgi:putative aldouronate transport system permease protein
MKKKLNVYDYLLILFLLMSGLIVVLPFFNVVVISFATNKEYYERPLMLIPHSPTLKNYIDMYADGRIFVGYRTTLQILAMGLPFNLFITTSFAYGLSRKSFPGRRLIFYLVLFTMLFNGGIIPMYMLMMNLGLTNKLASVVFAYGINTFYMIIMRNFFSTLPDSLIESARLDGAGEWRILLWIIMPLSMPIMATITLFYTVDRWNEWWNAFIFIKSAEKAPLQLVLRSIILDSQFLERVNAMGQGHPIVEEKFTNGLKMAAVMFTIIPVMCVYPFVQKHFVKGVLVGAIKS